MIVSEPESYTFAHVRTCLMRIITLCLDSDPSLVPISSKHVDATSEALASDDDFRFWSETQAKRIALCIRAGFGVEYSHDVILADANVSTLANRILIAKELS